MVAVGVISIERVFQCKHQITTTTLSSSGDIHDIGTVKVINTIQQI